jgi:hypothetical protein
VAGCGAFYSQDRLETSCIQYTSIRGSLLSLLMCLANSGVHRVHYLALALESTLAFNRSDNRLLMLIQVTNPVFLEVPKPEGYGFSQYAIAAAYATPIVRSPLNLKRSH